MPWRAHSHSSRKIRRSAISCPSGLSWNYRMTSARTSLGEVRTRRRSRRAAGPSRQRGEPRPPKTPGRERFSGLAARRVGTFYPAEIGDFRHSNRGSLRLADAWSGNQDSVVSIRISEGGRLFGIMAGLGGAAMILSAGLSWTEVVFGWSNDVRLEFNKHNDADRLAILVLGLLVVAGATCFIALGSRRIRMTAGALVVLAAAAGAVIALADDSIGAAWGGWGAILAAGYGIVALLRSGGEAPRTPAAGRSPVISSGATPSGDLATIPKRRMSDASLLAWTVVAIVIALVVGFIVVVQQICSEPTEWC